MGKLADRLTRRKSPEFLLIKELIYLARRSLDEGFSLPLEDRLEQLLRDKDPDEFERLYWGALGELIHAEDAHEVQDELSMAVESLISEARYRDKAVYLVALPFLVVSTGDAEDLAVTPEFVERAAQALKDRGLVTDSADVRILPRALPAGVAGALPYGTVYRMRQALAEGNLEAAMAALDVELKQMDRSVPSPAMDGETKTLMASSALLMLTVSVYEDEDALPLLEEFLKLMNSTPSQEERDTLYAETLEIQQGFWTELQPLMGVDRVHPAVSMGDWFEALYDLRGLERETLFQQNVQRTAGAALSTELAEVVELAGVPAVEFREAQLPVLRVPLRVKATGKPIEVFWPSLAEEQPHVCLQTLHQFLVREQVFGAEAAMSPDWEEGPEDEGDLGAPAAVMGTRILH